VEDSSIYLTTIFQLRHSSNVCFLVRSQVAVVVCLPTLEQGLRATDSPTIETNLFWKDEQVFP
jgi:hypothetical protein